MEDYIEMDRNHPYFGLLTKAETYNPHSVVVDSKQFIGADQRKLEKQADASFGVPTVNKRFDETQFVGQATKSHTYHPHGLVYDNNEFIGQATKPHTYHAHSVLESRDFIGSNDVAMKQHALLGKLIKARENQGLGDNGHSLRSAFRKAWNRTWGKLFSKKKKCPLGQSPVVMDPWGMPTENLPISVRREIEFEQAERRAMCRVAPFSRECQGELGESNEPMLSLF